MIRFKKLPGLSNYLISDDGKVLNIRFSIWMWMKFTLKKNGYLRIGLWYDDGIRQQQKMVHVLVATAFVPNPHNYPQVNHKDFDRTNNHYTNLEWCTGSQNMQHWADSRSFDYQMKTIYFLNVLTQEKGSLFGISNSAEKLGIKRQSISQSLRIGVKASHYYFSYKPF